MQNAENVEPMVDADHDNIATARKIGAVSHRAVGRTVRKATAM